MHRANQNVFVPTGTPEMSITALGPSANDVAAYFNTLFNSLDKECPLRVEVAHDLALAWLNGQMVAAVELAKREAGL